MLNQPLLEQQHQKQQLELQNQQLKEQQRVEQIKQLSTILKSNHQLTKQTKQAQYISFQFENLPELKLECTWWPDTNLALAFTSV
jgi:thiamine pyrophosphokinase